MPSFPIPFLPRSFTAAYRPVGTLRRRKLRIARSRVHARARSLRCSSSPQKVLRLFGDSIFAHFSQTISHRTAIQFSRFKGVLCLKFQGINQSKTPSLFPIFGRQKKEPLILYVVSTRLSEKKSSIIYRKFTNNGYFCPFRVQRLKTSKGNYLHQFFN